MEFNHKFSKVSSFKHKLGFDNTILQYSLVDSFPTNIKIPNTPVPPPNQEQKTS
jgi:hypothetical protein